MGGPSSQRYYERKDYQSNDNADLDTGEPELEFAKKSDTKVVNEDNENQKNCDPYPWVDFFPR